MFKFTDLFFFILNSIQDTSTPMKDSWPKSNVFETMGQFFLLIIIFIGVVFLAFYSTKMIASAKNLKKGGNLKVIESMSIGYNASIQIIRAGKQFFIIGITKDKISFLKEIDEGMLSLNDDKISDGILPFENHLKKFFKKNNSEESDHKQRNEK